MQSLFSRQNGDHAHVLAALVRATILDGNFWHRCQNYVHMVEDVLKALRVFDGHESTMEKTWLPMNNLKKHNFKLRNPPFNLLVYIAVKLEYNFTKKWDMMLTDVYCASALLNLYVKDVMEIQEISNTKHTLNMEVHKLSAILGIRFNS
jgi:hypothetical protein